MVRKIACVEFSVSHTGQGDNRRPDGAMTPFDEGIDDNNDHNDDNNDNHHHDDLYLMFVYIYCKS